MIPNYLVASAGTPNNSESIGLTWTALLTPKIIYNYGFVTSTNEKW